MKILIIGGTGNISYPYVIHALSQLNEVEVVNRSSGLNLRRQTFPGIVKKWVGDIRDINFLKKISNNSYDAVVDFLCFNELDARSRVAAFSNKTSQYIFVSTTAGYSKDSGFLPYTEKTPFNNLDWGYVKDKRNAELYFQLANEKNSFPVTIARLAHTYDTVLPIDVGTSDWTVPSRILQQVPIIMHGDGSGVWTLTHSYDVASALYQITINKIFIGDLINIVSDVKTTWREISDNLFEALGNDTKIIYKTPDEINAVSTYLGNGIIGHKMWDDFYDNAKLKKYLSEWVPSISNRDGIKSSINWYLEDNSRLKINLEINQVLNKLMQ